MKATKKIVGAACALVAAVGLAAGSTYAWFSSNGVVNATGLSVDVKTDNSYLVIARSSSDLSAGLTRISLADVGGSDLKLIPSAHIEDATYDPAATTDTEKLITNASAWYTGQGESATDGTLVESTKKSLIEDSDSTGDATLKIGNYVVTSSLYVGVLGATAVDTVNMNVKIGKPTGAGADTGNAAMSVVLLYRVVDKAGTTNPVWQCQEITGATTATAESPYNLKVNTTGAVGDTEGTAVDIDSTNYVEVKFMVYFNGNHTSVTTANQLALTGITLDFAFTDKSTPVDWTPGNQTVPEVTEP